MGKYVVSKNARCPHYRSENREGDYRIRCDGLEDGNWIHMVFCDRRSLIRWREEKCKGCWRACKLANMLEKEKGG